MNLEHIPHLLTLLSLGLGITAMAVTFFFSPSMVLLCRRLGMVASISERRSHKVPTPHGGGVIIPLIATPLGLVFVAFFHPPFASFLAVLLTAGLFVAAIGWQDDRAHLDPRLRLAVHLPAVAFALLFLPQLFDFLPIWAEKILLLLAWGWFVNLYNFMDGADGLATSESIAICTVIGLLAPEFAPLAAVIAGASFGFLRVNWSPAKVFMGDVGSTWFGYMLGGLLLLACVDDTWHVIWPLATITLVFSADATTTLIRRIATGYHPWEPHTTFWFHRYLRLGHTHRQLALAVAGLNGIFFLLGVGAMLCGFPEMGFVLSLLVSAAVMWYIRSAEQLKKGGHHGSKSH